MRVITTIILLVSFSANAGITEGGRGMLFGEDHAFAVTAMTGWVLDNESGTRQGLHMVFYPKRESWSNSPVIIYGRAVSTSVVPSIKSQVALTVRDFRSSGSQNYRSKAKTKITLPNKQQAEVYDFFGDKWGNYEEVAYFKEADTINYLVFNSRTKKNFDKYLEDFHQIVSSYQNLYIAPTKLSNEKLDSMKSESSTILSQPGGKEYESKATKAIGSVMATTMRDCTSYMKDKVLPKFSYFVRINSDGSMNESRIYPTNGLSACFNGLMSSTRYPAHSFETFVLNIEMKVTP